MYDVGIFISKEGGGVRTPLPFRSAHADNFNVIHMHAFTHVKHIINAATCNIWFLELMLTMCLLTYV